MCGHESGHVLRHALRSLLMPAPSLSSRRWMHSGAEITPALLTGLRVSASLAAVMTVSLLSMAGFPHGRLCGKIYIFTADQGYLIGLYRLRLCP